MRKYNCRLSLQRVRGLPAPFLPCVTVIKRQDVVNHPLDFQSRLKRDLRLRQLAPDGIS